MGGKAPIHPPSCVMRSWPSPGRPPPARSGGARSRYTSRRLSVEHTEEDRVWRRTAGQPTLVDAVVASAVLVVGAVPAPNRRPPAVHARGGKRARPSDEDGVRWSDRDSRRRRRRSGRHRGRCRHPGELSGRGAEDGASGASRFGPADARGRQGRRPRHGARGGRRAPRSARRAGHPRAGVCHPPPSSGSRGGTYVGGQSHIGLPPSGVAP